MKKRIIKPFDIEKAKAGAEVCTRDGRKARIVCFDIRKDEGYHILSLVTTKEGLEDEYFHRTNGMGSDDDNDVNDFDLFLVEYEEEQHQFKPFDKVLVRDKDCEKWRCNIFSHCKDTNLPYVCVFEDWCQCIPYEGNEHLLGTTNNPE